MKNDNEKEEMWRERYSVLMCMVGKALGPDAVTYMDNKVRKKVPDEE